MKDRQKQIPRSHVMKDMGEIHDVDVRLSVINLERARNINSEYFAGIDPRRRKEMADAGLVQEDHAAMANLPRKAIHHEYPRFGYCTGPYIDDSVIDRGNE